MSFDFLYHPIESLDESLTNLFEGAPLLVALGLAFLLGLRHASDPDHLVAVTSLVTAEDADTRSAARLGGWWGAGHAFTLLAIGIPLDRLQDVPSFVARERRREGCRRRDPVPGGARPVEVEAR